VSRASFTPAAAIKRAAELFTRGYFTRLIISAYAQKDCKSHKDIYSLARRFYGTGGTRNLFAVRWAMDFLLQAQRDLFLRHDELGHGGTTPIGFEDLAIHWQSSDANSSLVYLFGFSDNLVQFDLYRKIVTPGSLVIDVGANIGMHSLVLSWCTGKNGRVLSFEPSERVFQRLLDNIKLNSLDNIVAGKIGVGEAQGRQRFDMHADDYNIGKGRISGSGDCEIEITTLDEQTKDLAMELSFIKIDSEGYDLNVIAGACQTLKRHEPVLMCEFIPGRFTMTGLAERIPFDAEYFSVPNTCHEKVEKIDKGFSEERDVLIVPRSKAAIAAVVAGLPG
jgi:FkbM family methyltransferase